MGAVWKGGPHFFVPFFRGELGFNSLCHFSIIPSIENKIDISSGFKYLLKNDK